MIYKHKIPWNKKGEPHGDWEMYHGNGILMFKGNYINGNKIGIVEEYNVLGQLRVKSFYIL